MNVSDAGYARTVWSGLAIACVLLAALERWRRAPSGIDADAIVLASSTTLALVGIVATVLASLGVFESSTMTASCLVLALAIWPWRAHGVRPEQVRRRVLTWLAPLLLVGGGLALRLPVNAYHLAGRDQGTYTLRALQTLRTGSFEQHDPVLADAATDAVEEAAMRRSGPADLLGLYPERREPWRAGLYEAAYRPGWYLADRAAGRVVPQFLHLHPMLMATAGLVLGPERIAWVMPLQAAVTLLAIWCIARRLWPVGPWAFFATGLYATTPLVVWVHRTPLSEVGAGLFVAAAVLALLRARAGEARHLQTAALLLGSLAWLRGNGWLWAPAVLGVLWLVPGESPHRRRAAGLYVLLVWTGVLVHLFTIFPYVHDELRRQITLLGEPSPARFAAGFTVLLVAWVCIDALAFGRHGAVTHANRVVGLRRWAPRILVLALGFAIVGYLTLRSGTEGAPYSRLDAFGPLVGLPVLLFAGGGAAIVAWRWRPSSAADLWLTAMMAAGVLTVALYAQRNLPQLGLYYYGRYLVPEILPATILLATTTIRELHGFAARRLRGRAAAAGTVIVGGGLAWSVAGVLVTDPATRLQEFAGAERMLQWIADRVPEDAVIIAGGEGWHHGHTFNQVGGAIAMGHGRVVVPYRTREAAHATAWELLVARPQATGQPAPPVFLLVNEATHPLRSDGMVRAAMDDLLAPPLVAKQIDLLEMVVHRLTPTTDGPPTRVTQDDLRMGLVELGVEREALDALAIWSFEAWPGNQRPSGPAGLEVDAPARRRAKTAGRGVCLDRKKPLELRLPPLESGPHSVVLVATPGTAETNHGWRIELDGERRDVSMIAAHRRGRDTLGPLPVAQAPRTIRIRGASKAVPDAPCPHGGLLELRVLPADRPWLGRAPTRALTFAPPRDLGHPVMPTAWVSGRGLSRYRPGLDPDTEIEAVSLVVTPEAPIQFMPEPLPAQDRTELDLVVTLTATAIDPAARLVVRVDGRELVRIDPPDERTGSWQSKAFAFVPEGPVARFEVHLESPSSTDRVRVRDIGLFSREDPTRGELH